MTTTLPRSTWALLALGALTMAACSDQAVEPNGSHIAGDALSAKGGGGKPGGGGGKPGGGGGSPPAAEIAFHNNGSLWVMNADGSGRVELLPNDCSHSSSSWAPFGNGTAAAPFRIITSSVCGPMVVADVDTAGGSVNVSNVQQIHIAGDWWDTQEAGSPHYGEPAWAPGTGGEIVLTASWQANAATNEWVSALYVIATSELPNPTSQMLYQPPPGCSDAVYPAWSPDATTIAFVENCEAGGMGIRALDRATETVTDLLELGVLDGIGGIDWSRSGKRLAFSAGQRFYTLLLRTGEHTEEGSGFGASWSPDVTDSQLAFNTSGKRRIKIIDFATGNLTTLGNGESPEWRR